MIFNTDSYIGAVGDAHRKNFGQFFTHQKVADFMISWALDSGVPKLFDPAFGLGAFRPQSPAVEFSALEIDPCIVNFYREKTEGASDFIRISDYLTTWGQRHSNIICNPPYMRFQKFKNRDIVSDLFKSKIKTNLSGYTNTASAFLLKSISEMDGTGRLAYIMPLEFLNAGYGAEVKSRLLEGGHLYGIISLECEKDIFPDAVTSVGIILYDSAKVYSHVSFFAVKGIDDLNRLGVINPTSRLKADEISPEVKWLPFFSENKINFDSTKLLELSHYGRFSRGIATGANEFFVLSQSSINRLGLTPQDYVPCITRSAQIKNSFFSKKCLNLLAEKDAPVFLFSAGSNASKAAQNYIKYGEEMGFDQRFLTKHRTPWYKTEVRLPSLLLLGVFSRGGYKVILNDSDSVHLTCYHGFQPNLFGSDYVNHIFLYLSSKIGRKLLSLSMRKYGDDLDKFEPNDLNSAFVPSPEVFDCFTNKDIADAIDCIKKSGELSFMFEEKIENLVSPLIQ